MCPPARHPNGLTAHIKPLVDIGPWRLLVHTVAGVFLAGSEAASAQSVQAPWSEPPRLPASGMLTHFGLEEPVAPAAALIVLSLLAAWRLYRAGRERASTWTGILGPMAAVGLVGLAIAVETPREAVIARSLELARAVGRGDAGSAGDALAPTLYLKLGSTGGASGGDDRSVVLRAARLFPERVSLEGVAVPSGHASAGSETSARTRLRVRTGGRLGPSLTWWQLDWRRDQDGAWRVYTIELLLFNGQAPPASFGDEARRAIP